MCSRFVGSLPTLLVLDVLDVPQAVHFFLLIRGEKDNPSHVRRTHRESCCM